MTDHARLAEENFRNGCNCAQSVLLAFGDVTGLEDETALRLSASFGGGLGRLREVCGAVSGGAMVLGLVKAPVDPTDTEAKRAHYALVRAFAGRFREQNGSIICRELLRGVSTSPGGDPESRTPGYYQKRPCAALCRTAAQILDDLLFSQSPEGKDFS